MSATGGGDASAEVVVIGSGPAGAVAAARLVEAGRDVLMLDVANDDAEARARVPDLPFSVLRRTDAQQRRYFLGDALEGVPSGDIKVGAQLTPPRQFVTRDTEKCLPVSGPDFDPMQSLALGGLGAAWGAASFTWTEAERARVGLDGADFARHYDWVARRIGISGDAEDDASQHCFDGVPSAQPSLPIDSGAEVIRAAYARRREPLRAAGFHLGRTPLAALSRDLDGRRANPLFDTDFWGDSRRSVFRPRYLIEELAEGPRFCLRRHTLVRRFESTEDGVRLHAVDARTGDAIRVDARRVVLCAGAINSARIALHSLDAHDVAAPVLCNPYVYLPCLNLRMLGRAARDERHSLSQLIAIYTPPASEDDAVSIQLYGYRSLLLFKLVKEMPLPAWAGLQVARLLQNAITIAGLHHSDSSSPRKTLRVLPSAHAPCPEIRFDYRASDEETRTRRARERAIARLLCRLGVLPYGRIEPGAASSIHYAGTLPMQDEGDARYATRRDGRLWHAPKVYVGDSAVFRHLPAKGLTFTIMANASRVAEHVDADLAKPS